MSAEAQLRAMVEQPWRCSNCEQLHHGLFDLACFAPDYWKEEEVYEPNASLRLDGDFLSEDFCVLGGEYFFVRCVALIPVVGMKETFGYGVWSSLSRPNFEKYIEKFDTGFDVDQGPWFGWLSNRLKNYPDTLALPCDVYPQPKRKRPHLVVTDYEHPLALDIRDGMAPEKLLEIYEANGHCPERPAEKPSSHGWRGLFGLRK
jgi:hypothetical protein